MLYGAAKIIMTIACRFFYRRIYATGLESIPPTGPVIIIANHASSLMDAALLGILVERPIHFFTRGDIFTGKIASKILDAFHMIPVHHHETDRGSLSINNESFSKAAGILAKGGIVVFFPEGSSHTDRKLKSFRKGAFRLAFQSAKLDGFEKNIMIFPAGINYSHPFAYQADVMIHFGTPLLLNNYIEEYHSNAAAALLHITKDSFKAVEKQVLNIQDETKFTLAESCLQIKRNDYKFFTDQWMQSTRKKLEEEQNLLSNIMRLTICRMTELQENINDYFQRLLQYNLDDKTLSPLFSFSSYKHFLLLIGFPVFVLGYMLNCLPVIIAKRIADVKVYRIDFYSWIFVSCSAFLYIAWLITLLLGFLVIGWKYAIGIVTLVVLSGVFTHYYLGWTSDFMQVRILDEAVSKYPDHLKEMLDLRQKISHMIEKRF